MSRSIGEVRLCAGGFRGSELKPIMDYEHEHLKQYCTRNGAELRQAYKIFLERLGWFFEGTMATTQPVEDSRS